MGVERAVRTKQASLGCCKLLAAVDHFSFRARARGAQDRSRDAGVRGGDGSDLLVHRATHDRPGGQVLYMATLFGVVMLTHQVGGFLGAYLGGKVFDATGSYNWIWYADIVLAIGCGLGASTGGFGALRWFH